MSETLGQRITRLREEKGFSKQKLCRLADLNQTTLLHLERDKIKAPAYHVMVRLSEAFEVDISSWEPYIMRNID